MTSVDAYFAELNTGDGELVAGGITWRERHERPRDVVEAHGIIAVRSAVTGTTSDGVRVEFEPLTVLRADGSGVTCLASWHGQALAPLAVVSRYFEAANAEDWTALAAVWAPDGRLDAVGGPPREGRDDAIRAYRRFHDLFADHVDHVQRIIVSGRTATVVGRFHATNPHGVPIEFEWLDLFELTEDEKRIQRLWHWHDRDLARRLMDRTE